MFIFSKGTRDKFPDMADAQEEEAFTAQN